MILRSGYNYIRLDRECSICVQCLNLNMSVESRRWVSFRLKITTAQAYHNITESQQHHCSSPPNSSTTPRFNPVRSTPHLIRNPPSIKPSQMPPLLIIPLHPKHNRPEQHKHTDHKRIKRKINRPLNPAIPPRQRSRKPIDHKPHRQDRKVKRRVIMMHIRDPGHGHKRQIVQKPAQHRIAAGVVDMVDIAPLQLLVATLPAD